MATQRKLRRGTTSELNAFTPAQAEVVVDTTLNQLRVGDGSTLGGHTVARGNSPAFTGNATFTASSGVPVTVTNSGSGNSFLVEDSASTDTTPFVIAADGRVIAGHTASVARGSIAGGFQLNNTATESYYSAHRYSNDTGGPGLALSKSRDSTPTGFTIVQSGDTLGEIVFIGADGVDIANVGARIRAVVDGTPGSNDLPTRLELLTSPDGSATPAVRLGISNAGAITFPSISTTASAANAFLDSGASNNLLRSTSSARYKKDIEPIASEYSSVIYNISPIWYRSKAEADNPNWGYYGLLAEDVAKICPQLVHWAYQESDYEEVEVIEEYQEQETEMVERESYRVEIRDGAAHRVKFTETVSVPKFDTYDFFDEEGNPIVDEDGNPIKCKQPIMIKKTRVIKQRRLKDGAVKVPDGIMYDRLAVLMLPEIQRLSWRVKQLESNQ